MAIKTGDNFLYRGRKPLDSRDSFETIAEMIIFPESSIDDGHITYVKENDKYYKFNSDNETDEIYGKWREYTAEGGTSIDDENISLDSTYSSEMIDKTYSKTKIVECTDYADMQAKIASGEYGEDCIFSTPDVNNILDSISDGSSTDIPVGHIMSFMGNNAPKHYLICDGTEYNITDYPYLASYLLAEFGVYNYFGGDGTTTFKVPDLRGEFLRGSGVALRNTGSGSDVGIHQDPTVFSYFEVNQNNSLITYSDNTRHLPKNIECATLNKTSNGLNLDFNIWSQSISAYQDYTSRPTNTSVLYCIKYEPTYNANVTFNSSYKRDILFEGASNEIQLDSSILNYDQIVVKFKGGDMYTEFTIDLDDDNIFKSYGVIDHINTVDNTNSAIFKYTFNLSDTYILSTISNGYIQGNTYTDNTSNSSSVYHHICKVIGIKY